MEKIATRESPSTPPIHSVSQPSLEVSDESPAHPSSHQQSSPTLHSPPKSSGPTETKKDHSKARAKVKPVPSKVQPPKPSAATFTRQRPQSAKRKKKKAKTPTSPAPARADALYKAICGETADDLVFSTSELLPMPGLEEPGEEPWVTAELPESDPESPLKERAVFDQVSKLTYSRQAEESAKVKPPTPSPESPSKTTQKPENAPFMAQSETVSPERSLKEPPLQKKKQSPDQTRTRSPKNTPKTAKGSPKVSKSSTVFSEEGVNKISRGSPLLSPKSSTELAELRKAKEKSEEERQRQIRHRRKAEAERVLKQSGAPRPLSLLRSPRPEEAKRTRRRSGSKLKWTSGSTPGEIGVQIRWCDKEGNVQDGETAEVEESSDEDPYDFEVLQCNIIVSGLLSSDGVYR